MSNDIQKKIEFLQQEYTKKLQVIQANQEWHLIEPLTQELQKAIEAAMEENLKNLQSQHSPHPSEKSPHYRHSECELDLDHFVYDGDRTYFEGFLNNPMIAKVALGSERGTTNSKKALLKHAMRLSAGMAPKVFKSIDRCREKLGLTAKIDIYISQDPSMNAFCYPSHEGCIYILITSALLEKLNDDELTFVIGHEIGHFLYQHHLLSPRFIHEQIGNHLSPSDSIKLFSWGRNAELSADRIGLICCGNYEAACMANFKISSGISSDVLSFSLGEYLKQYEDIEQEMSSGNATMEDFYSSHPINPMRVIALDIFNKSETYLQTFSPDSEADLTESEMENKIESFMKLMEPQYLNDNNAISKKIKEFIFLGGLTVASSDGEIAEEEMKQLAGLLPEGNYDQIFSQVKDWNTEMKMTALGEQADSIRPHLSQVTTCNIIRDLTLISLADGELVEAEFVCLCQICLFFNIHPSFLDQVLNSINYQQAA